jgi:hypothetical protein
MHSAPGKDWVGKRENPNIFHFPFAICRLPFLELVALNDKMTNEK